MSTGNYKAVNKEVVHDINYNNSLISEESIYNYIQSHIYINFLSVCVRVRGYVCICMYVYYVCVCVCMCMCVCVCIYIYIYIYFF